jgi:hypothetical protein
MVSTEELIKIVKDLYKSEHPQRNEIPKIPENGVQLGLFRTFENRLIERSLVSDPTVLNINPLWFLGETERNIFLWRNKKSIKDAAEFSFWLDVRKLASKRLAQLESNDSGNPFLNSLWGTPGGTIDTREGERRYIQELLKLYAPAEPHLTAISTVQCIIYSLKDFGETNTAAPRIVSIPLTPTQH